MMFVLELTKNPPSNVSKRGLRRMGGIIDDYSNINKEELNKIMAEVMNKKNSKLDMSTKPIAAPDVSSTLVCYEMSKAMADTIVKNYKGSANRIQEILCDYVNRERGLKGYCVRVNII